MANSIWAYINPNIPKSILPSLKEPRALKPMDIDPQKTTLLSLKEGEKEEFQNL